MPKIGQQPLQPTKRIRVFLAIQVAMIALAALIVVTRAANAVHHIETILKLTT